MPTRKRLRRDPEEFCLQVFYRVPSRIDTSLDRKIIRAVGQHSNGSGYDFVRERRDLGFPFSTVAAARAAAKRVRHLGSLLKTKILRYQPSRWIMVRKQNKPGKRSPGLRRPSSR